MNEATLNLVTAAAFAGCAVIMFILGTMFLGGGRNQPETRARRPLMFGPLTRVLAAILPLQFERREALEQDLRRAGYYHRYAREEYLAMRNVMVVCWTLLVAAAFVVIDEPGSDWGIRIIIGGVFIGILLLSGPRLLLQAQASSRLKRIQYSLPDALDMLTMTMAGGLPLPRAMEHVSREIGSTYPDLSCELGIIRRQTEAGSLDQALREFSKRIDIPDVQSLTALVSQTERLGSNVATAFRDYSDSVRRTQRQRAEERGNRTSVAMILPIVLCLAPPIYILLLGPALMQLRGFVAQEDRAGGVLRPDISGMNTSPLPTANARTGSE
ncbi:MAG: type II secretion system F family protein [Pirellulaceae bacterium]|nr:type II secretion system F family protein [Pirellulaceae bacterium]